MTSTAISLAACEWGSSLSLQHYHVFVLSYTQRCYLLSISNKN